MSKVLKYILPDILRNKIVLLFTGALLLITISIINISETPEKIILSLLNIELIVLPLVCLVFATIYFYNAAEFMEVLAAQPLKRRNILFPILAGLTISLVLAFMIGTGIPLLLYYPSVASVLFVVSGIMLIAIFTAFATVAAVFTRDKAHGVGLSLLIWFYFTLIFDGIILFLMFRFSEYPIEKGITAIVFLNPVDLVRIMVLLQTDNAALMGYTGAVFRNLFGSGMGMTMVAAALLSWLLLSVTAALRKFRRKDL